MTTTSYKLRTMGELARDLVFMKRDDELSDHLLSMVLAGALIAPNSANVEELRSYCRAARLAQAMQDEDTGDYLEELESSGDLEDQLDHLLDDEGDE